MESTKGSASMLVRPGWMPQSSMIFLSLNWTTWQDRPTSWPEPSGVIFIWSDSSLGDIETVGILRLL